jgi:hypothetical protein
MCEEEQESRDPLGDLTSRVPRAPWMIAFSVASASVLRNQRTTSEAINKHEDQVLLWLTTLAVWLLGVVPGYIERVTGSSDAGVTFAASWPLGLAVIVGVSARMALGRLITRDLTDAERRAGTLEFLRFRPGLSDQEFLHAAYTAFIGRHAPVTAGGDLVPADLTAEAASMKQVLVVVARIRLAFHTAFATALAFLGFALTLIVSG